VGLETAERIFPFNFPYAAFVNTIQCPVAVRVENVSS